MRRVREPGYGPAETSETIRAAGALGLRVVHVPVDGQGIDVAALGASGAQAVVVTPAHQSPTGVVLAAGRRHALVDWAAKHGAFVPPSLADAVAAEKRISDRGSSTLDQLAMAALLESGRYDRHLRRMRGIYASRRTVLIDALARHASPRHPGP